MPTTTPAEQSLVNGRPANRPARVEFRISFMTAALVLLGCLTAGAVTAAYVFQERLTPVTARPSATR